MAIGLIGIFTATRKKVSGTDDEKPTWWGFSVAGLLILAGILSILVESDAAEKEAKKIEQERLQIARENQIRDEFKKDLTKIKSDVESSLDGLDNNLKTVRAAEENLKELSKAQIEQQLRNADAIKDFESEVNKGIERLSTPLRDLRFSLSLQYKSAKENDPEALELYRPMYIDGEQYGIEGYKPNIFYHQGPGNFVIKRVGIAIFDNEKSIKRGMESASLSYELRVNHFYENAPIFYSDIKNNTFRGLFNLSPSDLINNDFSLSSMLDITDNTNQNAVTLVSINSGYIDGIILDKLKFHDKEARYVGAEVTGCKFLDQYENVPIVDKEGKSRRDSMTYRYICPMKNLKRIARHY